MIVIDDENTLCQWSSAPPSKKTLSSARNRRPSIKNDISADFRLAPKHGDRSECERLAFPARLARPTSQTRRRLHLAGGYDGVNKMELMRDVDRIIALVKKRCPGVKVEQLRVSHPADDDGIWFFSLLPTRKEIQIESSDGMCPFVVEHDGLLTTATEALGISVDRTVELISDYLLHDSAE
jgi:hypothetical protein